MRSHNKKFLNKVSKILTENKFADVNNEFNVTNVKN